MDKLVDTWRQIIVGDHKLWVLFAHGTYVVLVDPADDLAAQAVGILHEYGPVLAGSPAGDFGTIDLAAAPGWVVWSHHPDVLTYVGPEEVSPPVSDASVNVPPPSTWVAAFVRLIRRISDSNSLKHLAGLGEQSRGILGGRLTLLVTSAGGDAGTELFDATRRIRAQRKSLSKLHADQCGQR